ncbi:MAG TPA: ATP-binding protein, partial [Chthonomonadales bacterium]|nr:ATP-binding protein [Chthonomonadales bacterium]
MVDAIILWTLGAACALLAALAFHYARQASRATRSLQEVERNHLAAMEAAKRDLESLWCEYEAVLDRCGTGILLLSSSGEILRANAVARQVFGLAPRPLEGKALWQATLSYELNHLMEAARADRRIHQSEVRTGDPGGRTLNVSVSPLPGEAADRQRFLLVAQDVSELRRLETIRRDFVANVSHELRTPLTSIRAMAETLQDGAMADPTVAADFLGTIVKETERLTRISEDLLILSQTESGTPEKKPFDLAALIRTVIARFVPQAEKAGLSLHCDVPEELQACANADQMEQVIVNLVDNAIKYTPAGGSVQVTAEKEASGVSVHVADTGIGIMSEDLPRIFERFYRVVKARSRRSGGTGLGLSIVKHIVEAHGGY